MAAIIWTDVTAFAPSLSTIAAGAQTDLLAFVNAELKVSVFGGETAPKTRLARIYLAAHFATAGRRGGAGGALTSESAGGLSKSYGSAMSDDLLATTQFGQLFLTLVDASPARCPVVV